MLELIALPLTKRSRRQSNVTWQTPPPFLSLQSTSLCLQPAPRSCRRRAVMPNLPAVLLLNIFTEIIWVFACNLFSPLFTRMQKEITKHSQYFFASEIFVYLISFASQQEMQIEWVNVTQSGKERRIYSNRFSELIEYAFSTFPPPPFPPPYSHHPRYNIYPENITKAF